MIVHGRKPTGELTITITQNEFAVIGAALDHVVENVVDQSPDEDVEMAMWSNACRDLLAEWVAERNRQ